MPKRTLQFEILAQTKKATKELGLLQKRLSTLNKKITTTKKNATGFHTSFKSLAGVTAGFVGVQKTIQGIGAAIKTIANFETQIAKLGAISNTTGNELKEMEAKAKELGATTQYTASQVAEGMNFLAMAGFDSAKILESTEGVLNLATVGMLELGEAADISSNVLTGFSLEASEMGRVVDVMSKTITSSNTNVQELGSAFSKVAPIAARLNLSIEETAALLGTMADAGIKAELAGTQLKIALNLLSTDSGTEEALRKLEIRAYDVNGRFKGMIQILSELKPALAGLSEEAQNKTLADIFGKRAVVAAGVLLNTLDNVKKKFKENQEAAGTADRIAKAFMDTLNGAYKELLSALEAVVLMSDGKLNPALRELIKNSTDWLRSFTKDEVDGFAQSLIDLSRSLISVGQAIAWLSDIAVPDWISGKEGSGLFEGMNAIIALTAKEFKDLGVTIENVFSTTMEDATKTTDALTESVEKFTGTKQQFLDLIDAIKLTTAANTKQIELWRNSNSEYFADDIKHLAEENRKLLALYKKLSTKRPHDEAAESAEEAEQAQKALSKAVKIYGKDEVDALAVIYKKREKDHGSTIKTLNKREKDLVSDIIKLNEGLVDELGKLGDERNDALRSSTFDASDLSRAALSDIQAYNRAQLEATKALAKSRKLLSEENIREAESYFQRYQSLIREGAGSEIKAGKNVLLTKQQTTQRAIKGIQEEKRFIEEMYQAKARLATEAHNTAVAAKKVELEATKAQIILQQELLRVVKELVKALTGKEIAINTDAGTAAIDGLISQVSTLDASLKSVGQTTVKPTVDSTEVEQAHEKLKIYKTDAKTGALILVKADTTTATTQFQNMSRKMTDEEIKIRFKLDDAGLKSLKSKQAQEAKKFAASTKLVFKPKIELDTDTPKQKLKLIKTQGEVPIDGSVDMRVDDARAAIDDVSQPISIESQFNPITGAVDIARQNMSQPIYVPVYYQPQNGYNSGGLVQHFATGGAVYPKRSNKVPGVGNGDTVPAMLTPGEFILKKSAVKKYGTKKLMALNAGKVQHFATGGLVDNLSAASLIQTINSNKGEAKSSAKELWAALIDTLISKISSASSTKRGQYSAILSKAQGLSSSYKANSNAVTASISSSDASVTGRTVSENEYNSYLESRAGLMSSLQGYNSNAANAIKRMEIQIAMIDSLAEQSNDTMTMRSTGGGQSQPRKRAGKKYHGVKYGFNNFFATGGLVPGSGNGDTVPAMLTPGEYVIKKDAVSLLGHNFLEGMNNVGKYADGGYVDAAAPSVSTREVRLTFADKDGSNMETMTDEETASKLENYFRKYVL